MKIAIIDSGIHAGHAHVGAIAGGICLTPGGRAEAFGDTLGHGTAVAAAIHEKAPDAALYAVKVFDQRLSATMDTLLRALEWCVAERMEVINLSLGTANEAHRARFEAVIAAGALIVSAADYLPGRLTGVIGVAADAACLREEYRFEGGVFQASPYPRPIPGVPVERNLQGVSFAVAHMTAFTALALERATRATVREALIRGAAPANRP